MDQDRFLNMVFRGYKNRPRKPTGELLELDEVFSGLDLHSRVVLLKKFGLEDGEEKTEDEIAFFFSTVLDRDDRNVLWVAEKQVKAIQYIRNKYGMS